MTDEVTFELYEIERDYPDLMVASVCGPEQWALAEIQHYAAVYAVDGAVLIKRVETGEQSDD